MVIAQAILVTPIIAALTRQTSRTSTTNTGAAALARRRPAARDPTLLWDGRFSLMTAAWPGFGRAIAEVGAVIIVGGNINHVTRVMTTTIALETARATSRWRWRSA